MVVLAVRKLIIIPLGRRKTVRQMQIRPIVLPARGATLPPRRRPEQEITILILKNKINFMFDRSEFTHPPSDGTNTKSKSANSDCFRGINFDFLIKKEWQL